MNTSDLNFNLLSNPTFFAMLSGSLCRVTATIDHDEDGPHYTVEHVATLDGKAYDVTSADLDIIEAHIEGRDAQGRRYPSLVLLSEYQVRTVEAHDVLTGGTQMFTVYTSGDHIHQIRYASGVIVRKSNPQFTEVAEAYAIDRQFQEMEDAVDLAFAKF